MGGIALAPRSVYADCMVIVFVLVPGTVDGDARREAPLPTRVSYIRWLGLVAVIVAGCSRTEQPVPIESVHPLPIYEHVAGNDLKTPDLMLLINTRDELDALEHERLSALNVDFRRRSILIVALGEKPTSGWWVRIDSAQRHGSDVYFQGVVSAPGEAQVVNPALTYPYAAAVIPKVKTVRLHPEMASVRGKVPHVR